MIAPPVPSSAERRPPPGADAWACAPGAAEGLSNDYLNHFSEALMLIELAADDPPIGDDLAAWRPLGYREHFAASGLRRAAAAIRAYDALAPERRAAFEDLTGAMDRLIGVAVAALKPPCGAEDAALVAEVTAPALRRLIARAALFLNSGGRDFADEGEVEEAQAAIDPLIDRVGGD